MQESNDNNLITITEWDSIKQGGAVGRRRTCTVSEFFAQLKTPQPITELSEAHVELPVFSPAVFQGDSRKKTCEGISALVLDYNDGSLDVVASVWVGFTAFLHTTKSHIPEAPRCRVILPLTRAVTVTEHAQIRAWAQGFSERADVVPDKMSKDPARVWFFPATVMGRMHMFAFRELSGQPLSPDRFAGAIPTDTKV